MPSLTQTPYSDNPVRAVLLLLVRVVLGLTFMGHGWDKFSVTGLDATAAMFAKQGIPAPRLSALLAATLEMVGGACILLGAFTWVACTALALLMAAAFFFVHQGHGLLVSNGGWELVGALGSACVLLALASAGDYSIDQVLEGPDGHRSRRRRRR